MIRRPIRRWFPLFMGPMVCAFIIGFVYPFCKGIYLSFCKFKVTSDAHFVGLENYRRAFQDASFVHSFWFTALFAVISLVLINVLASRAATCTARCSSCRTSSAASCSATSGR